MLGKNSAALFWNTCCCFFVCLFFVVFSLFFFLFFFCFFFCFFFVVFFCFLLLFFFSFFLQKLALTFHANYLVRNVKAYFLAKKKKKKKKKKISRFCVSWICSYFRENQTTYTKVYSSSVLLFLYSQNPQVTIGTFSIHRDNLIIWLIDQT